MAEISYQIEHTDRIIAGNVSNIEQFENYMLVTIEVNEWLINEHVILMLKDINVSENEFKVTFAEKWQTSFI